MRKGKQTNIEMMLKAMDLIDEIFKSTSSVQKISSLEKGPIEQTACRAYAAKTTWQLAG